nr:hypothetical protein Iba_chr13cCG18720 [Ipomoea batatas]
MFCQNQPSSPSMLPMNSNSQQNIHKARFHFPVTEACSLLVLVYQGKLFSLFPCHTAIIRSLHASAPTVFIKHI